MAMAYRRPGPVPVRPRPPDGTVGAAGRREENRQGTDRRGIAVLSPETGRRWRRAGAKEHDGVFGRSGSRASRRGGDGSAEDEGPPVGPGSERPLRRGERSLMRGFSRALVKRGGHTAGVPLARPRGVAPAWGRLDRLRIDEVAGGLKPRLCSVQGSVGAPMRSEFPGLLRGDYPDSPGAASGIGPSMRAWMAWARSVKRCEEPFPNGLPCSSVRKNTSSARSPKVPTLAVTIRVRFT